MRVAIVIVALVLGSVAFHLLSPWWQTPLASNWEAIDSALNITLLICAVAFIALNLFLALALIRFRHRPGHRARYDPENPSLEKNLTFWTALGIAGMLAPGLVAWGKYVDVPKDAAVVEAIGQQWQWTFRFPGPDRVLGTAGVEYMTPDNPFGVNPLDPFGRDDILVESNELHLPKGQPVKMILRSKDVLHDFYVPEFRAKMDLVPGIVTYFWMTPTQDGTYDILCAELCGTGHHQMRGSVVVEPREQFEGWLAGQMTFSDLLAGASPEAVTKLFAQANTCTRPATWGMR
ncbi:cytochrome-c oxidase [Novosphingobium endophyticum]|uniref:cytochrome-c oxidase n=1 Tax=Novosphingobium endophyticum TaxID=1955250 RepID=A0A916TVU6_9SPHN|nr:cytochrome c oxidase subunit II [Novosphingobium endophyticum]GGC12815.1 cytochrome-c oxidase [Novosphingobium endophyticum]